MTSVPPDHMDTNLESPRPICGAMTRRGTPCRRPAGPDGRCWMHAGQPAADLTAKGLEDPGDPSASGEGDGLTSHSPPPVPIQRMEGGPETDDLIEIDLGPDLAEPSPPDGHLPAGTDIPPEEIDIREIEAVLDDGDSMADSETMLIFDDDDPVLEMAPGIEGAEASDPALAPDGLLVADGDEPLLEISSDFEEAGASDPALAPDGLLVADGDEPLLEISSDFEEAGASDPALAPDGLLVADGDEPLLEISSDFEEAGASDSALAPDGLLVADGDEPMLEISSDFEEAGASDSALAPDGLLVADGDEPMLEISSDFEEAEASGPELAPDGLLAADDDEPMLEMASDFEEVEASGRMPEPDGHLMADDEPVLSMAVAESDPDSDPVLVENAFESESFTEAALDVVMAEEAAPPVEGGSGPIDREPEPFAGGDGSIEDSFDLSFGIEIEEVPFSPDVVRKDEPETGAGEPVPVAQAAPIRKRLWWKRTVRVPVLFLAAVVVLAGIGFGLIAVRGQKGPAVDTASGLRVIDPAGAVVENTRHGQIFVIRGKVRNDDSSARRRIGIRGRLFTRSDFVKTVTVFAGHDLPEAELAVMPPGPLLERLSAPPQATGGDARLAPGQNLPFTIVFTELPKDLAELDRFTVEVVDVFP